MSVTVHHMFLGKEMPFGSKKISKYVSYVTNTGVSQ
jgi:hypothetical protein